MNRKNKQGFTIIEVVLVLAIAGLIFLMVFIALPALQRSQRNTQRRDDYSMLVTAVNSYMSSNNGRLGNLIKNGQPTILTASRWVNSTGEDPSGNPYEVKAYAEVGTGAAGGAKWTNSIKPGGVLTGTQASCSIEGKNDEKSCKEASGIWTDAVAGEPGSQVFIIIKANCGGVDEDGDPQPRADDAARSFAVYGYLEGGGYFCQDSGSTGTTTN